LGGLASFHLRSQFALSLKEQSFSVPLSSTIVQETESEVHPSLFLDYALFEVED